MLIALTRFFILAGNLKHKNLMGDVVSSQAYIDDQNDNMDNVSMEDMVIDEPTDVAGE